MLITDFGSFIAERMRAEHQTLAARWFGRLLDILPVEARDVFPTESLLDHVPALILEVSDYLNAPEDAAIAANTAILEKARELGALRHAQQASLHQVLREYQVLGGVLVTFVIEELERAAGTPTPSDCVRVVSRVHQAVNVLSQVTVEAFVTLYTQTITDQGERLEQFTRMAAHEWRQPLSALQFGVKLLGQVDLAGPVARRTVDALQRTVAHLVEVTTKLEAIARMTDAADNLVVQEVAVSTVAAEAARQVREMADARGVDVRVSDTLPVLTVDVGRLELTFLNLLSNAIKYSDPAKPARHVDISGALDEDGRCRIVVRDNGIGIPLESQRTVFHRFTRGHGHRDDVLQVSGLGLGLAIVEDCVQAMGGEIELESTEGAGTAFVLRLPAGRLETAR